MKKNDAKRSQRRAQKARMKDRARKIFPGDPNAKNADHLKSCSCFMCGNPRKFEKKKRTIRERIATSVSKAIEDVLDDDWKKVSDDWKAQRDDWQKAWTA